MKNIPFLEKIDSPHIFFRDTYEYYREITGNPYWTGGRNVGSSVRQKGFIVREEQSWKRS